MAQRLSAYVFCGYPEIAEDGCYNSMQALNPQGELVRNYRKHFLYCVDKTWSKEGPCFDAIDIVIRERSIRAGLAICMDINPYEFTAPYMKMELANYWKKQNIDIGIFCTNWNSPDEMEPPESVDETIDYWAQRLYPLYGGKHIYFCAANRVGYDEARACFVGGSCVLSLNPNQLEANLSTTEENILAHTLRF